MLTKRNKQSFLDIKSTSILKKFHQTLKTQKQTDTKTKKTHKHTHTHTHTHIIEYIFAKTDLEQWTYQDIYKLLSSTSQNSNCMIDIMLYTKTFSAFIHIENGKHKIVKISPSSFFSEKTFQNFIEIVKKNQKKYQNKYQKDSKKDLENLNSIFVFGGHCNGWKCYTDDYTVDFEMIYNTFIKNNMKFNAICFDCCYSSTFELLYQFHDLTDYIIAHQSYVYGNGFNTRNLSKIFNIDNSNNISNISNNNSNNSNNISFLEKLIILCMDYLVRTIDEEKEFSNFTIIDTYHFKDFLKLFKENYQSILGVIHNKKSKHFLTDVCNKCLIDNPNNEESIYNNMLDLYSIVKILGNKKLIELYKKSVFYRENDIKKDGKYFNQNTKLNGINIIINPPNSKSNKYYLNLRFLKDF